MKAGLFPFVTVPSARIAAYLGGMRLLRRHIAPWALGLLIALTAQAAAVAHAAPGPSGTIELCNSTGPVMVYVDAEGKPVGAPVYCPDFALTLILALSVPPVMAVPVGEMETADVPRLVAEARKGEAPLVRHARGPPSVV